MCNLLKSIRFCAAGILVLFLFSCQKELSFDTPPGGGPTVTGVLKMKINGQQWTADKGAGASLLAGLINISGIGNDKKYFTITIFDTVLGTYDLDQLGTDGGAALSDSLDSSPAAFTTNQGNNPSDAGGVVIVTQIDKVNKTISGSFQFKLFRDLDNTQKVITEGVFDKLPYTTSLPPASTTDTFRVKIDGVDWNGKSITTGTLQGKYFISATELNLSKTVGLTFPTNIAPGTYDLDFFGGNYIGVYNPTAVTALASESGKLTIIENNAITKRLRGNFDFKASDLLGLQTAQLTQGYFSVKTP